ncbi:hypothetical protein [Burkholderia pyrrocinia]
MSSKHWSDYEELFARYVARADLALEASGRQAENPSWSLEAALGEVGAGVQCNVSSGQWDVSRAEIAWVIRRAPVAR